MGSYIAYPSPSNDCSEQNASNCDKAADTCIGPTQHAEATAMYTARNKIILVVIRLIDVKLDPLLQAAVIPSAVMTVLCICYSSMYSAGDAETLCVNEQ